MDSLTVKDRVQRAFERATPIGVSQGPETAAYLQSSHQVAQAVAREIADILANCNTKDDYLEVMRGLTTFAR